MPEPPHSTRRRELSLDDYAQGVLAGDRATLARAITLIESDAPRHVAQAQELLRRLLPHTGRSIRVGVTGAPGVGKSTLIEAIGVMLCERGRRVAVLAVDPSSSVSGGSIMGDKTRMERLARHPGAFVRPSPAGGALGGVARKTRESLLLCEAAGYDTIIVETVGVGQSETAVRAMVDFFLLLVLAGAGDELQAIKKGVIEMADALLVTKADGENEGRARHAQADYARALRGPFVAPATLGWRTPVATVSALTGAGVAEAWELVEAFRRQMGASGAIEARRRAQAQEWLTSLIDDELRRRFYARPAVAERLPALRQAVMDGTLPALAAAQELLALFEKEPGP